MSTIANSPYHDDFVNEKIRKPVCIIEFTKVNRTFHIVLSMFVFIAPVVYGALHFESLTYIFYLLPWLTGMSIHLIATGILGKQSTFSFKKC